MLLGEFHSAISDEINQDERLDTLIAGWTRRAARYLERNYSFLYMERFVEVVVNASAENARFVPWPAPVIKKLNFVRQPLSTVQSDSSVPTYKYLVPIDAQRQSTVESTQPNGYWITGSDDLDVGGYLVLDQIGDDDVTLQSHYVRFTDWPTADAGRAWLLENAEEVMIALTMQMMAPAAQEPDWIAAYQGMFDKGIKSMIDADVEMRSSGDYGGFKMVYQ